MRVCSGPQCTPDDSRAQPAVTASRSPRAARGHPDRQRSAPRRACRRSRRSHLTHRHHVDGDLGRGRTGPVPRRDPDLGLRGLPDTGQRSRRRPPRNPIHPRRATNPGRLGTGGRQTTDLSPTPAQGPARRASTSAACSCACSGTTASATCSNSTRWTPTSSHAASNEPAGKTHDSQSAGANASAWTSMRSHPVDAWRRWSWPCVRRRDSVK